MQTVWLIIKWLLVLVVVLLILGFIYEQYSRYNAKNSFVDNGTYVEVNGHKMHYQKVGEGKPTVIFESGLDFTGHLSWRKVQDEVSKFAMTISYDRAGILRSEKSDKARTCENMAEELHLLLEKIEVKEPYILVAHSLGGLIARCYAKKYTHTLSGIVFVDASHPDQISKAPQMIKAQMKSGGLPSDWVISLAFDTGFFRWVIDKTTDEFYKDRDDIKAIKSEINAYLIKSYQGSMREMKMLEDIMNEAKGVSFVDIPFTVLTATQNGKKEFDRVFFEFFSRLQEESLSLSTQSKHISVDSGHFIQLEKPDVVVGTIREMVGSNQ